MLDFMKTREKLNGIADKHQIKIGVVDSIRMMINDGSARADKQLFYQHLDHFQKLKQTIQQR